MKILVYSYSFAPKVGGIESVSAMLAETFVQLGHSVRLLTQTSEEDAVARPYRVTRKPGARQIYAAVRWCDVFFHNNISLPAVWPRLFLQRPWVVTHQTWISRVDGNLGWRDQIKRWVLRMASNVAISRAVAAALPTPCQVIPNPYDEDLFRTGMDAERSIDLIFLGRLVSDKGLDLLLDALGKLHYDGLFPRLTVIGSGPELERLKSQAVACSLSRQVEFTGPKRGPELASILRRHRIMVVPSRWAEPFGVVALEGIACGCVVIGSSAGGLPEAIGPCGVTFPNGDVEALTEKLQALLHDDALVATLQAAASGHLQKHTRKAVGMKYLRLFEGLVA